MEYNIRKEKKWNTLYEKIEQDWSTSSETD